MTDKQLIRAATDFRKGIVGKGNSTGMCFAICAPLQSVLGLYGVTCTLAKSEVEVWDGISYVEHYYLELPDGRILDPSADQFSEPPARTMPSVYLGEKPEWYLPVDDCICNS